MDKDFSDWMLVKRKINNNAGRPLYREREVWWCSVGSNVGYEADGKGKDYVRPVLILKDFNHTVFWAVPMTTQLKSGKYYFDIDLSSGISAQIMLSQLRFIDSKRLHQKIEMIDKEVFIKIKQAIADLFLQ
ncbi:MAG TPA: type II toxin-antitoxin system PemK/MazF family toxin [Candidatus Paceibacterota bacterium]|nr:type II toxin-antitoxin system PemK/MazF family toxin [Candidatus Paceibacterota bacterium]